MFQLLPKIIAFLFLILVCSSKLYLRHEIINVERIPHYANALTDKEPSKPVFSDKLNIILIGLLSVISVGYFVYQCFIKSATEMNDTNYCISNNCLLRIYRLFGVNANQSTQKQAIPTNKSKQIIEQVNKPTEQQQPTSASQPNAIPKDISLNVEKALNQLKLRDKLRRDKCVACQDMKERDSMVMCNNKCVFHLACLLQTTQPIQTGKCTGCNHQITLQVTKRNRFYCKKCWQSYSQINILNAENQQNIQIQQVLKQIGGQYCHNCQQRCQ